MEEEPEFGVLTITDETGDRKFTWRRKKKETKPAAKSEAKSVLNENPVGAIKPPTAIAPVVEEPEDIKRMRELFKEGVKGGRRAYAFNKPGHIESGRPIDDFDPEARFIVITEKLYGGK